MKVPRHPGARVRLTGEDGNAGMIMGRVTSALKREGVSRAERDEFRMQAISGDYDHLLQTVMAWVTVDDFDDDDGLDDLTSRVSELEAENARLRKQLEEE